MTILYLANLDDIEISDVVEEVAAWAISYDNFYVYSRNRALCKELKDNVLSCHQVNLNVVCLSSVFPLREVGTVLGFMLGFTRVQFVSLDTLVEHVVDYTNIYITESGGEDCYGLSRKYSGNSIKMTGVAPVFQLRLVRSISSMLSLCEIDKRFMTGDSFLTDSDIFNREGDTDFDCLKLRDFLAAESEYLALFSSELGFSSNLRSKKSTFLSMCKSVIPVTSSSFPETRGFPSIFKVLSAYFYFCSDIKVMKESNNSAFLYAFRALETYCDGLLIYLNLATVGNVYNASGQLKKRDAFKLLSTGQSVMGFGGKWGLVKSNATVVSAVNQSLINKISLALRFRNKFNLTHGDLKINSSVLSSMQSDIMLFITSVDNKLLQKGFEWSALKSQFDDFITYNPLEELRNLVNHSFPFEVVS